MLAVGSSLKPAVGDSECVVWYVLINVVPGWCERVSGISVTVTTSKLNRQ